MLVENGSFMMKRREMFYTFGGDVRKWLSLKLQINGEKYVKIDLMNTM